MGIRIGAIWNDKMRQWLQGRKNLWNDLERDIPKKGKNIWLHVSSAGEFEQAKPLIEALKTAYPVDNIILSFFSPSGYNTAKNYIHADCIFYLPFDTKHNAARLFSLLKPRLVIFVKYDFWYHHLKEVARNDVPLLLVSAVFSNNQLFFKWYGHFYKNMLLFFSQIFVQNEASLRVLVQHGIKNGCLGGDTRFDRVKEIANHFEDIPLIKEFLGNTPTIVAGSTWPDDEKILVEAIKSFPQLKLILAPHEINATHLHEIKNFFPSAVFYSELKTNIPSLPNTQVVVIDNVGMLSRLYHYASVAYIGGGFTRDGIHNSLEAAVFGKPMLWGPTYNKYPEAVSLIERGAAISIKTAEELKVQLDRLLDQGDVYKEMAEAASGFVSEHTGATKKLLDFIQEKRLLTN